MTVVEGELIIGIGPIPKTHLDQPDQDQITDVAPIPSTELIGSMEHIHQQGVMVVEVVHRILSPTLFIERLLTRDLAIVLGHLDNLRKSCLGNNHNFPKHGLPRTCPGKTCAGHYPSERRYGYGCPGE